MSERRTSPHKHHYKMKITKLFIGSLLALGIIALAGCQTKDVFYSPVTKQPAPVTNAVPVYAEADVERPANTNFSTGVITPAVPKPGATPTETQTVVVMPPPVTEFDTNENFESAKTITSAVPVYGGLATLGLTALGLIGKLWLNRKQPTIIKTTFQSVETWANAAIASGDPKAIKLANSLKTTLANAHDYANVAAEVQKLIDAYTSHSGDAEKVAAIATGN